MGNLLRSDFYRLFKSKSFYICTAIALLLISGNAFLMEWSYRMMAETQNVSVALTPLFTDGITYGLKMFSGGDVHLFMAIFIAIFITGEYTHGTMKNVVSKGFPKHQIYLSKIITMTAATFIMIFLMFLFGTASAAIVTGKFGTFTGTYVSQILIMVAIELLLHVALTAVFVLVANTIRNNGGVIAINIIGVMSIAPLMYQAAELIFRNKIKFTQFGLRNNIALFYQSIAPAGEDVLRAILVGLVFFAVTTAIGIFAFKKMDVK
jgi:ABC-2 type transport system permease protein